MAVVGAVHIDVAECPSAGLSAISSLLQTNLTYYRHGIVLMLFDHDSRTYTNIPFSWNDDDTAESVQAVADVILDAFDTLKTTFPNSYNFGRLPRGRKHSLGDWTSLYRSNSTSQSYSVLQFAATGERYRPRNVNYNGGNKTAFPYVYKAPEAFFQDLKYFEATVWASILAAFLEEPKTKALYNADRKYSPYDTFCLHTVRNFHFGMDREEVSEPGWALLSHRFKMFYPDDVQTFYSLEHKGNPARRQDVVVLRCSEAIMKQYQFTHVFRRFVCTSAGEVYWCEDKPVPFRGFEEDGRVYYTQVYAGQLLILTKDFEVDPTIFAQTVLTQLRGVRTYLQRKIHVPKLGDLAKRPGELSLASKFVEPSMPQDFLPKVAMVSRVARGVYTNYPSEIQAVADTLLNQSNLEKQIKSCEDSLDVRRASIERCRRDIQALQRSITEHETAITALNGNIASYKAKILPPTEIATLFASVLPVDRTAQHVTTSFINFCKLNSITIHEVHYGMQNGNRVYITFTQENGKLVPNIPADFNPFQVKCLHKVHFTLSTPIVNVLDSKPKDHIALVGPFEVIVEDSSLMIRGLEDTVMYKVSNYKLHPHIGSAVEIQGWSRPCTGTFGGFVSPFMESGDLLSTLKAALSWIKNNTGPDDAWSNEFIRAYLSQSPLHTTLRGLVGQPQEKVLVAEKVLAPLRGYYNPKDGTVSVLVENVYASLAKSSTALGHYDPAQITPYALLTVPADSKGIVQTDTQVQINFPQIFAELKRSVVWDCVDNLFRLDTVDKTNIGIKVLKTTRFRFDYKITSENRVDFNSFVLPICIEKKTETTKVEAKEELLNA